MLAQPIFTLTFPHAVAVIIGFGMMYVSFHIRCFDNLTVPISGSTVVGFVATLGPRLGMRTMVITRYSFGYWGTTLVSFVNILTQVRHQY